MLQLNAALRKTAKRGYLEHTESYFTEKQVIIRLRCNRTRNAVSLEQGGKRPGTYKRPGQFMLVYRLSAMQSLSTDSTDPDLN